MSELNWGRYEELRPEQIELIRRKAPIAYLPWGALEWHSFHNPIGLDGMQSHGQCSALAQRTGGVVLPPVYLGTDTIKPFKGFPHSIEIREELVEELCLNILEELVSEKFTIIVVLTGHMGKGQTDALARAETRFLESHPDTPLWVTNSFEIIKEEYPYNHAARGETSHQLYFDGSLVDLHTLPNVDSLTLDDHGIWGSDPRNATRDEGRHMVELFVSRAAPHILDLLEKNIK